MAHFRSYAMIIALLILCASPLSARAFSLVSLGAFSNPVDIRTAPGQPNLLYVVEKAGRIVILRNEVRLPTPFLSITDIVLDWAANRACCRSRFRPITQYHGASMCYSSTMPAMSRSAN